MKWILSLITLGVFVSFSGISGAQVQDDLVLDAIPDGPVAIVHDRGVDPIDFRDLYLGEIARFQIQAGKEQPVRSDQPPETDHGAAGCARTRS